MPRLFAAEPVIVRPHVFQNVAVANRRDFATQAQLLQSLAEADIAHDCGDDGFIGQRADFEHQLRADNHDVVAVDNVAALVNAKATVGVAVVRNANRRVIAQDFKPQRFHVRGAAIVVDVDAVWLIAEQNQLRAQPLQNRRHSFVSRAVRAVQYNLHAVEAFGGRVHDEAYIVLQKILSTFDMPDALARRSLEVLARLHIAHDLLNLVLDLIGKLVAVAAEKFNAVVPEGVMRRADNYARRRMKFPCQVSNSRSRNHAR